MSEQSNSTNEPLPDFIKPYQNIFYKGNLYCHTCDVYVNSQAQLSSHNKTLKHLNLEKNDKNDKILRVDSMKKNFFRKILRFKIWVQKLFTNPKI